MLTNNLGLIFLKYFTVCLEYFLKLNVRKDEGFGNARVVRNLFEKCVQNQANRVIKIQTITKDVLRALTEEDIPEPKETVQTVFFSLNEE